MLSLPRCEEKRTVSEVDKYQGRNKIHTDDQLYGFSGSPSSQEINFRVVGGGSSLEVLQFREVEIVLSSVSILYRSSASAPFI